ncbi:hypothetical protein ACIBHX_23130 [Nonomuraea sp. NPDC050536]|uniref:hypothetical protein n=1 Tax=Nonomuraea sp. NPDC050536 TaxID=3364366 RepID=UPI0037C98122
MSVDLTLAMPLRRRVLIDACMDNDASVETVDGNRQRVGLINRMRCLTCRFSGRCQPIT